MRPSGTTLPREIQAVSERGYADSRAQQICAALDEFLTELQAGRTPSVEEWLARHAEIAAPLREQLDGLLILQAAVNPAGVRGWGDAEEHGTAREPDRSVGNFRLRREIGRGGMGIVYEADDLTLGRRVALKLLPFAAVLDHKQLARFQNEAQAASRLHHPHIVPVFSVGCDRGTHFYAMQ